MKVERKVALTLVEEIAQLEYQVQIANAAGNKRALSHAERAYYEFTRALQIIGIDGLTRRIDGDASCRFFDFDPEVAGASDTGDTVAVPKREQTGKVKWTSVSLPGLLLKRADRRGCVYGVQVNSITDKSGISGSAVRIFLDGEEAASWHTNLGKVATAKMADGALNALISYHDVRLAKKNRRTDAASKSEAK